MLLRTIEQESQQQTHHQQQSQQQTQHQQQSQRQTQHHAVVTTTNTA